MIAEGDGSSGHHDIRLIRQLNEAFEEVDVAKIIDESGMFNEVTSC